MKLKQSMVAPKPNELSVSNLNDDANNAQIILIIHEEQEDFTGRDHLNSAISGNNVRRNHLMRRNAFANIWHFSACSDTVESDTVSLH